MDDTAHRKLIRKLKLPIPMQGIEIKITLAVLLTLIAGVLISRETGDQSWFARSGSVVVLLGIYLVWRDLVSLVGDVRKLFSESMQSYLQVLDSLPQFQSSSLGIIGSAMARGKEKQNIEIQAERAMEHFDLLKFRIRSLEAIVLTIGTFTSGFGDVVPIVT